MSEPADLAKGDAPEWSGVHFRRAAVCKGDKLLKPADGTWAKAANQCGVIAMDLRVIVKPDVPKEKTQGGIILPESKKDQDRYGATKGVIVSIGENAFAEAGATMVPPVVGDRVMFGKYAGTRFEGTDGEDYIIMNDADILGRLEE